MSRFLALRFSPVFALAIWASWIFLLDSPAGAQRAPLPRGFVYLRDIDDSIAQDMKYATPDNFTGRPVSGYHDRAECIVREEVARALANVQKELRAAGYSLKVYDCYRPQRAVRSFVTWVNGASEDQSTRRFHPDVRRQDLLALGYIARTSSHSRGVAVDAALTTIPPPQTAAFDPSRRYGDCTGPKQQRSPDSSLDFGSGFDCFDEKSHTQSTSISKEQARARALLSTAMAKHGFVNYAREWWHFTLNVRGATRAFDFPVQAHPGASRSDGVEGP